MGIRLGPQYQQYLSQKYRCRDWDYETVERLSGNYENWEKLTEKLTDWFYKALCVFMKILLALLFIALVAFIGFMCYLAFSCYKTGDYAGMENFIIVSIVVTVQLIIYIRTAIKEKD